MFLVTRSVNQNLRRAVLIVALAALVTAPGLAQTSGRIQVDLPAQSLGESMDALAKLFGLDVIYLDETARNAPAPAMSGRFTAAVALEILFEDTDFIQILTGDVVRVLRDLQQRVVVTGSRIQGAEDTGAIVVSVIDQNDIQAFGAETPAEIYENIAQVGQFTINETTDTPNFARGDVAAVNLRELGAGNTLVLLNGRRLTPHPFAQDVSQTPTTIVNLNAIPTGAIDRVEVLRDGASALYGADATAGVVNTVLDRRYEGLRFNVRGAQSEDTDFQETSVNFSGGWNLNEGKTNVTVFGTLYDRDGMFASERYYSESVDKRPLLPADWAGDTQFRNTSTSSPWGEFQAGALMPDGTFGGIPVTQGGSNITRASDGRFHIQPDNQGGGVNLNNRTDLEIDDGSQSTSLRYDFNIPRQITPDIERRSFFGSINHVLEGDLEFFAEVGYYDSDSLAQRATQPVDDGLAFIIVPRQNYWNPLGPVGSPNRLPGIDAPAEGLDVLIRRLRPLEHGARVIQVESDSLRLLGGFRGKLAEEWDWESALFHHTATTRDEEFNRISKTGFLNSLALTTPDAFNPFAGVNFDFADTICCQTPDNPANSQATLDSFRISSVNESDTELTSWDFRLSSPTVGEMPGGPIGLAFGTEWRHEFYEADLDPRLDGTITFGSGAGSSGSDVVGVSPTADSTGNRDVYSVFGEALFPLIGPQQNMKAALRLDLQLAVRLESISDTGEDIAKPKVALSWMPAAWLTLRGTYAEGFRAPNLVQLNRGDISRLTRGQEDFWRADVTGLPDDTGDTYRRSIRISNSNLESEETETTVYGIEFRPPFLPKLAVSVDFWKFDQENVIDNFGVEEQLAFDFLLRKQGSSNPSVIRAPVTAADQALFDAWNLANPTDLRDPAGVVRFVEDPYQNLDPRTVEGMDIGFRFDFPRTGFGRFRLQAEAQKLDTFDQQRFSLQPLFDDPLFASEFTSVGVDQIRLNGKPEWKSTGSLTWRHQKWGAGVSYRFIDDFLDTSATNDTTGEFWTVRDWTTFNGYMDYRFKPRQDQAVRLRLGVNNIGDRDPPLADETRGYFSSYHSNRGRQVYVTLRYDL